MDKQPVVGEVYKLFDKDLVTVRYEIEIDWVRNGIVRHHIRNGAGCAMECTVERWADLVDIGKIY